MSLLNQLFRQSIGHTLPEELDRHISNDIFHGQYRDEVIKLLSVVPLPSQIQGWVRECDHKTLQTIRHNIKREKERYLDYAYQKPIGYVPYSEGYMRKKNYIAYYASIRTRYMIHKNMNIRNSDHVSRYKWLRSDKTKRYEETKNTRLIRLASSRATWGLGRLGYGGTERYRRYYKIQKKLIDAKLFPPEYDIIGPKTLKDTQESIWCVATEHPHGELGPGTLAIHAILRQQSAAESQRIEKMTMRGYEQNRGHARDMLGISRMYQNHLPFSMEHTQRDHWDAVTRFEEFETLFQ